MVRIKVGSKHLAAPVYLLFASRSTDDQGGVGGDDADRRGNGVGGNPRVSPEMDKILTRLPTATLAPDGPKARLYPSSDGVGLDNPEPSDCVILRV
jgi:hypothetical protein